MIINNRPLLITPDTNVLISGITTVSTPPGQIIYAWQQGLLEIALSEVMIEEFRAVLSRPYHMHRTGWTPKKLEMYIQSLYDGAAVVVAGTTPITICRDPNDNMVFATALEAKSDCIVSGDKDILAIKSYHGILTISPRSFIEEMSHILKISPTS